MASNKGLYDPRFEHDACGIGFVASIKGSKSHQHISDALTAVSYTHLTLPTILRV